MANNEPIVLRNWTMYIINKRLSLAGMAENHPKIGVNVDIAMTSSVLSIDEDKSHRMTCRTKNSVYVLDWRFANISPTEVLAPPMQLDCAETVRDKYITYMELIKTKQKRLEDLSSCLQSYRKLIAEGEVLNKEFNEKLENELLEQASKFDNCIYMSVSSVSRGNKIAYNISGNKGIIKPVSNGNCIVTSVEYETDEKSDIGVKLKYYVGKNHIEIFDISDNVETIVVHSNRRDTLVVNGDNTVEFGGTIMLETKVLKG